MTHIYIIAGLVAAVLGVALTYAVRRFAVTSGILDKPDGFRKVNVRAVPRMGGVAVFIAVFTAATGAGLFGGNAKVMEYVGSRDFLAMFVGASAVVLIGLLDDIYSLRARYKLALLTAVAAVLYGAGYQITQLSNPFGNPILLGNYSMIVTLVWFLACMNAMNLIDGLDGLAAGVALFAVGSILVSCVMHQQTPVILMCAVAMGAVIGFLFFNFHPASIMLGDSGSYLLGFLVACVGLRGAQKSSAVVGLLIPVIALGLPFMDTTLAILRRWSRALPISSADRQHIHHRLLDKGLSHRQTVLVMYVGCMALAAFTLLLNAANHAQSLWLLLGLGIVACLAMNTLGRVEIDLLKKRFFGQLGTQHRDVEIRKAGYEAAERMKRVASVAGLWDVFASTAARLELDSAQMTLRPMPHAPCPANREYAWSRPGAAENVPYDASWCVRLKVRSGTALWGEVTLCKATKGMPLSSQLPEITDLMVKALGENLERLQSVAPRADESRVASLPVVRA